MNFPRFVHQKASYASPVTVPSSRVGFRRGLVRQLLVGLALVWPLATRAQYQTPQAPLLGSAWYPEQLPESDWERDLTLMQQAGFNVVRMGEFAWSTMEPSEGHYDLDWLGRAIAAAGKHRLKVVLGTPTDAPPAWLTRKYPDTLGTNADGRIREHGSRRQFNYANLHYRQLCAEIVRHMGQRFGHNPNVLGWQIDNEYTDESFDPATVMQFQAFLKARFGTLANLNAHWTTAYWSQTYTDWSQIPMQATSGNPGLLLEHKHFVTATWRSYQQNQIDVLRPLIDPSQFITTNFGGLAWSDNWDHYAVAAPLDLITWDDYVGEGHLNPARNAMLNDFVRGWKRENFWLMETQPGSVNWAPVNNALAPGETRALAWQAIGHGADAILYWQWRPALNGQEQYHGSIVGPGGDPRPLYTEVQQLGRDLAATQAVLTGTTPRATIALLHTYDSRWAIDFQPQSKDYDQQQVLLRFYEPLQRLAASRGEAVDIIDPTQSLSFDQYKLLVAPSLNVIDEALAAKLLAWVKAGGTLLLGPRSGMKDQYNALNPQRQPGPLAEALGAHVEQFYALDKGVTVSETPLNIDSYDTHQRYANIWAEPLTITDPSTKALLLFSDPNGWLDNQPGLVNHTVGAGSIAYLGALPLDNRPATRRPPSRTPEVPIATANVLWPSDASLTGILHRFAAQADLSPGAFNLPDGVEACTRTGPHGVITVLINHLETPALVDLPQPMRDLLSQNALALSTIALEPQQVAVLKPAYVPSIAKAKP